VDARAAAAARRPHLWHDRRMRTHHVRIHVPLRPERLAAQRALPQRRAGQPLRPLLHASVRNPSPCSMHARTHTHKHARKQTSRTASRAPHDAHTPHAHLQGEHIVLGQQGAPRRERCARRREQRCDDLWRARACVRATMQRASPPCVHVHLQRYYARASTPPANTHRWHRTAATKAAAAVAVAGVAAAAATCQGPPGQIMLKRPRPKKYGLTMVSRVV
jgi:hypothetical protein